MTQTVVTLGYDTLPSLRHAGHTAYGFEVGPAQTARVKGMGDQTAILASIAPCLRSIAKVYVKHAGRKISGET